MNKYYEDEILRLSVEISLLLSGSTISMMSDALKINRSVIREDMIILYTCSDFRDLLRIYDYKDDENEDYDIIDAYRDAYVELTYLHKDLVDSQDEKKELEECDYEELKKNFVNKFVDSFYLILDDLPEETSKEEEWKEKINNLLKDFNEIDINKNDIREDIKREIDNARDRYMRRIAGTTEKGARKGHNKGGEKYGIRSGKYDDTEFKIDGKYLDYDEYSENLLVLTSDDYTHLDEFLKQHDKSFEKMYGLFKVKNSIEMKEIEAEIKFSVLDKIKDGKCIKFMYKDKNSEHAELKRIKPEWVDYNSDTGFLYIVDSYGYKYRIDRIQDYNSGEKKGNSGVENRADKFIHELDVDEKIDKKKKLSQKKVNVKIVIRKKEGFDNLISKIKDDVRKRNMNPDYDVDEHFSENDKEYVYTDKILESNLGELKSWIYSYGSSMVVEKPETLRKQIIESYQKRKDYY